MSVGILKLVLLKVQYETTRSYLGNQSDSTEQGHL